ncbi:hypothetical protein PV326_001740, partial [Microctonus aethiopoides]
NTNITEKINKRGPGRPRKYPVKEVPNKKLAKRKRGRPRKKRISRPHTNLQDIVLTLDSTDSTTNKNNPIKKKPRINDDDENTNDDNDDTSDSEASVYSIEMGINPRILHKMQLLKSRNKENTTSDSDGTPHHIEKIRKRTEKKNQKKQIEDCHVKLDHSYATDRNKIHTLRHSPPYSSDKKISKKTRIISESEVESINADSNNDNEYTLAQNIPLPTSHSSSETETASENENNNRESYPQRIASINNNVEEQSLPITTETQNLNTIDDNNRISDINNQILQINNSSGSEEGINNIIIATAEVYPEVNENNMPRQSPYYDKRRIKRKRNCNKSSSGSMTVSADINIP